MRIAFSACLILLSTLSLSGCDDDPVICADLATGAPDVADFQLRNPETGQCESFGGGYSNCGCGEPCLGDYAPIPSWGSCYSQCEALDESSCQTTSGCRAAYMDTCPPNADCSEQSLVFAGCWSTDTAGPTQGGECSGLDADGCSIHDDCSAVHESSCTDGSTDIGCIGNFLSCMPERDAPPNPAGRCYADVTCADDGPDCPMDTLAGIGEDGCWTDYCIPVAECEVPTTTCAELATEPACVLRADCDPLYRGEGCTCNGDICTCQQVFETCVAAE